MEELFSLLLRLVPAALFAGYWILMIYRMLSRRRRQRQDAAGPSPQAVREEARRPADDEYEVHFSAWDLPVNPESEVPAPPVPQKPVRDLSAGVLAEGKGQSEGAVQDQGEAPKPVPAATDKPERPRAARVPGAGRKPRRVPGALPPLRGSSLKGAVIWAEILGPPKGL